MDILNWLASNATTGDAYHTLMHCMSGDVRWFTGLIIMVSGTVLQYLDIAYVAWYRGRSFEKSELKDGFIQLTFVFAFCAVCGYGFRIMQTVFPAYKVLVLSLIVLNYYTNKLRYTIRHSDFLSKLYSLEDKTKTRVEIQNIIANVVGASSLSRSESEMIVSRIRVELNKKFDKI